MGRVLKRRAKIMEQAELGAEPEEMYNKIRVAQVSLYEHFLAIYADPIRELTSRYNFFARQRIEEEKIVLGYSKRLCGFCRKEFVVQSGNHIYCGESCRLSGLAIARKMNRGKYGIHSGQGKLRIKEAREERKELVMLLGELGEDACLCCGGKIEEKRASKGRPRKYCKKCKEKYGNNTIQLQLNGARRRAWADTNDLLKRLIDSGELAEEFVLKSTARQVKMFVLKKAGFIDERGKELKIRIMRRGARINEVLKD